MSVDAPPERAAELTGLYLVTHQSFFEDAGFVRSVSRLVALTASHPHLGDTFRLAVLRWGSQSEAARAAPISVMPLGSPSAMKARLSLPNPSVGGGSLRLPDLDRTLREDADVLDGDECTLGHLEVLIVGQDVNEPALPSTSRWATHAVTSFRAATAPAGVVVRRGRPCSWHPWFGPAQAVETMLHWLDVC